MHIKCSYIYSIEWKSELLFVFVIMGGYSGTPHAMKCKIPVLLSAGEVLRWVCWSNSELCPNRWTHKDKKWFG